MAAPIRVVVGEDQAIVREGVIRILEHAGFDVVGQAADAEDLVRIAIDKRPDVVVTDIKMPPTDLDDGLQAALSIRALDADIGVIVLSQFLDAQYAVGLVGDGANGVGYLLKEKVADPVVLVDAVQRVAAGGSALDADVIAKLVERKRHASPLETLTPRERVVLGLMAEGLSNSSIAKRLAVTLPAVERHVTGILTKLQLPPSESGQHRRVAAVLAYLQR
jgi:DNA-binding NarL/FixJ family response regulator